MAIVFVLFYSLMSICEIINLFFIIYEKKKNLSKIPVFHTNLNKFINTFNLPLVILAVLITVIEGITGVKGNNSSLLIFLSICILTSFTIQTYIFFFQDTNKKYDINISENMYQPVFELLKHYYDFKLKNEQNYNELLKNINSITELIENNRNTIASAYTEINEYFKLQKNELAPIVENRDFLQLFLSNLRENVQKCNDAFELFIQKLDSSNASIKYSTNSEILLQDIRDTFQSEYRSQTEHINSEISNIVDEINNISYKCGQFVKLFSLFDGIIQLYSNRIESSIKHNTIAYYDPDTKEKILLNDIIQNVLNNKEKIYSKSLVYETNAKQVADKIKKIKKEKKQSQKTLGTTSENTSESGVVVLPSYMDSNSPIIQSEKNNINNYQLEIELEKTKSWLKTAIILGILAMAVSITLGSHQYSKMKKRYSSKELAYVYLDKQYKEAKKENKEMESNYQNILNKIMVTSITFGYYDSNNEWSGLDVSLHSKLMKKLYPYIDYYSTDQELVKFYIKIIRPDGQLENNTDSPSGFTYTSTIDIYKGLQQLYLDPWESSYRAGTWTFEIWYNHVCLKSKKFKILP